VKEIAEKFGVDEGVLLLAKLSFIQRAGWQIKLNEIAKKK